MLSVWFYLLFIILNLIDGFVFPPNRQIWRIGFYKTFRHFRTKLNRPISAWEYSNSSVCGYEWTKERWVLSLYSKYWEILIKLFYLAEPSLWLGTNRGSVFGFSLDISDESGSRGCNYNLLGESIGSWNLEDCWVLIYRFIKIFVIF